MDKTRSSQYIFALYYIFEVITTVGYGDYAVATTNEYIFMLCLEFIGLIVFSFLMGSITDVFGSDDDFEQLVERKIEDLDKWISKVEKSAA